MPAGWRAATFTLVAVVGAMLGWYGAGWVAAALGVAEVDLPARAAGVFLALTLVEAGFARLPASGKVANHLRQ